MKKTLVLVTKPLSLAPKNFSCAVFAQADHVTLIQDGVYNRPGDMSQDGVYYGMPGGHRAVGEVNAKTGGWPDDWSALKDDVSARRVEAGCRLIDYAGLVEAIEEHEKIVTI